MKKILVVLSILSVIMFTNVYAEAMNVRSDTFKDDEKVLMRMLDKGQCGQICLRYERNTSGVGSGSYAFGFCRVSITVCKD